MPDRAPLVRLCHITTVPTSLVFLRGQVGYMRERGFDVSAISSPGEKLDAFGKENQVAVFAVPMPRKITLARDLLSVLAIARRLRRLRPHVVHAHTPKGGLLGMMSAALVGAPVRIYHMRGLPFMGATGAKRALLRKTEWLACRLAHRVICVSHSIRKVAVAEGLCPPEKIAVMAGGSGQGVDAGGRFDPEKVGESAGRDTRTLYDIPEAAVVIGFVGRLVRDKGLVELEASWQVLREEFPDLHLLLVGPWEPQDPVPADVRRRLESDSRVHFAGEEWNTPPLYAAMDVVALPTYREGFPNVPLEAAAMGLPIVATDIPGCIDAIQDGVTGRLVPPRDSDALANAAREYLRDPEVRREHGRAGRERVLREFRQEVVWGAIHDEYLSLLRSKGLPLPSAAASQEVQSSTEAVQSRTPGTALEC